MRGCSHVHVHACCVLSYENVLFFSSFSATSKPFNQSTAPCRGLCISGETFCSNFLEFGNFPTYLCVANCSAIKCQPGHVCLPTECESLYDRKTCSDHQIQSLPVCYSHTAAQKCEFYVQSIWLEMSTF